MRLDFGGGTNGAFEVVGDRSGRGPQGRGSEALDAAPHVRARRDVDAVRRRQRSGPPGRRGDRGGNRLRSSRRRGADRALAAHRHGTPGQTPASPCNGGRCPSRSTRRSPTPCAKTSPCFSPCRGVGGVDSALPGRPGPEARLRCVGDHPDAREGPHARCHGPLLHVADALRRERRRIPDRHGRAVRAGARLRAPLRGRAATRRAEDAPRRGRRPDRRVARLGDNRARRPSRRSKPRRLLRARHLPGRAVRLVAIAPREGTSATADTFAGMVRSWRFAPDDTASPVTRMWKSRKPVRISDFSIARDNSKEQTPQLFELSHELDPRSLLLAPVIFRRRDLRPLRLRQHGPQLRRRGSGHRGGARPSRRRRTRECTPLRGGRRRARGRGACEAHARRGPFHRRGLFGQPAERDWPVGGCRVTSGPARLLRRVDEGERHEDEGRRASNERAPPRSPRRREHRCGSPRDCAEDGTAIHIANETIVHLAPLAAEKSIDVSIEASPAVASMRVNCDTNRIQQVLGNIIGNAIKFTPRGGSITVGAPAGRGRGPVLRRGYRPGDLRGCGRAHLRPLLAWLPARPREKGVGLGLFIAKGIVEAHGGRISLARRAGAGATFCFTLPLTAADPRTGTTSAGPILEPTSSPTEDEP